MPKDKDDTNWRPCRMVSEAIWPYTPAENLRTAGYFVARKFLLPPGGIMALGF
jgi:hypothetical protein